VNWIWFEFQVESNLNRNWMRFGSKRFHLKLKWNPTYLLCGVDLHLMCLWILGKLSIDGALCSGGQIMLFTYPLWEFVGKHFWFKDQDSFGVQTQKHQQEEKNKEKKKYNEAKKNSQAGGKLHCGGRGGVLICTRIWMDLAYFTMVGIIDLIWTLSCVHTSCRYTTCTYNMHIYIYILCVCVWVVYV